ncbi:MAG: hypothetical protein DCC75_12100 [Proteobacteria bacterium]|nr:MAG: hypothetical protein DCC75_12100 [Pseudomonadota bacterium]
MENEEIEKRIAATSRTCSIIAVGFTVPVFFFPLLAAAVIGMGQIQTGIPEGLKNQAEVLVALSLVLMFLGWRLSQLPLEQARKAPAGSQSIAAAYLLSVIINFSFREAGALVGFVLSLSTRNLNWCVGLGLLAFILMMRSWPKSADLRQLVFSVRNAN